MTTPAVLGILPEHYERLGITREIQPFEDGLRTDPARAGHYEWWYYDAHLDDGSTLVVNFLTKSPAAPQTGLKPLVTIDLTRPDGVKVSRSGTFDAEQFSASTDGCDVRIGRNTFSGDLHEYRIAAAIDDMEVEVVLTGTTEPWRPATGHIFYGEDESAFFAWLPSVPHGTTAVRYRIGSEEVTASGHGYHDHNWGNVSLREVVHHWYWGRGAAGPYTFITSQITSEAAFGYTPVTVFMLARDGRVIAEDGRNVEFSASGIGTDAATGKPVADVLGFEYRDDEARYRLEYRRRDTILRVRFVEALSWLRRLGARLIGFDGAYLRFTGDLTIMAERPGYPRETIEATALWELMYFGRPGDENG